MVRLPSRSLKKCGLPLYCHSSRSTLTQTPLGQIELLRETRLLTKSKMYDNLWGQIYMSSHTSGQLLRWWSHLGPSLPGEEECTSKRQTFVHSTKLCQLPLQNMYSNKEKYSYLGHHPGQKKSSKQNLPLAARNIRIILDKPNSDLKERVQELHNI